MKKLNLGLAVLALSAASTAFAAPTGTINFTGKLLDSTCDASLVGASPAGTSGSFTLQTMNIAGLAKAGDTIGDIAFTIKLTGTGCTDGGIIATPYFEAETTKVNAAGRLINTATGATAAKNVDIQIVTANKTAIDLMKPALTQEVTTGVDNGANTKDFTYYARYFATGAAEKGDVTSSVSYSIFYK